MSATPHPRDVPTVVAQLVDDVDACFEQLHSLADHLGLEWGDTERVVEDDPTEADVPGWLTDDVETLAGRDYTRDQLDAIAADLGVPDPEKLDNKRAVADAIVEARP